MGRYITWADIANTYPSAVKQRTADEVGSWHIVQAEAAVDGRLASKFTVPFSSNNITARELAIVETVLRLNAFQESRREEIKKELDERYKRLLNGTELMIAVTSGDVVGSTVAPSDGTAWSSTKDYTPVFGMGEDSEFRVDSSQLYDEEQDRE